MTDHIDKLIEKALPLGFDYLDRSALRAVAEAARQELARELLEDFGKVRVNWEQDKVERVLWEKLREMAEPQTAAGAEEDRDRFTGKRLHFPPDAPPAPGFTVTGYDPSTRKLEIAGEEEE